MRDKRVLLEPASMELRFADAPLLPRIELDRANAELKKRHPKATAFGPDDLYWVYHPPGAGLRIHIARWGPDGSTGALVTLPPKPGKPTVEVYVQPR